MIAVLVMDCMFRYSLLPLKLLFTHSNLHCTNTFTSFMSTLFSHISTHAYFLEHVVYRGQFVDLLSSFSQGSIDTLAGLTDLLHT